jgi:hypothetical protein
LPASRVRRFEAGAGTSLSRRGRRTTFGRSPCQRTSRCSDAAGQRLGLGGTAPAPEPTEGSADTDRPWTARLRRRTACTWAGRLVSVGTLNHGRRRESPQRAWPDHRPLCAVPRARGGRHGHGPRGRLLGGSRPASAAPPTAPAQAARSFPSTLGAGALLAPASQPAPSAELPRENGETT